MDVVIYAAKSTADKRGSIPTQLADCRELADREGWTVVAEHSDEGFSAYTGNRGPGLEAARSDAEAHSPCMLLAQHSDRFARGAGDAPGAAEHLAEIGFWARRHGVQLRSVQDDSMLTNPLLTFVMGERNYEDSRRKSGSVKSAKRREFEKGRWPGGPVPDGYTYDKTQKELYVDPVRAPIIARTFELANDGLAMGAVARRLNHEGHRTKRGNPWTGETVKDTLSNPVYAGRVAIDRDTDRKEVRDGIHEALIDGETFDRLGVTNVLRGPGRAGRPSRSTLLSGLAVCDRCGGRIWGRTDPYARKDGTRRRSYLCRNRKAGACDLPRLDADLIDKAMIDHVAGQFIDFEEWARKQTRATERVRTAAQRELAATTKTLAAHTKQRDKIRERYLQKQSDANEEALEHARRQVATAEQAVTAAQAALDAIPGELPMDAALDWYNAVRAKLDTGNEAFKAVFKEFRIDLLENPNSGPEILVAPVLRPDLIEAHAHSSGTVRMVSGENAYDEADPSPSGLGSAPEPLLVLIQPPPSELAIPINMVDYPCP